MKNSIAQSKSFHLTLKIHSQTHIPKSQSKTQCDTPQHSAKSPPTITTNTHILGKLYGKIFSKYYIQFHIFLMPEKYVLWIFILQRTTLKLKKMLIFKLVLLYMAWSVLCSSIEPVTVAGLPVGCLLAEAILFLLQRIALLAPILREKSFQGSCVVAV